MSKLSVVIPTYTLNKELEDMALEAVKSYRYGVDELIVCEDGGHYSPELMAKCDTYIYNWKNEGFTKNVNRGWRFARGDFVIIASSDTYLTKGSIRDLMVKGKVTSPIVINQVIPRLAGPLFCTPKEITKDLGYLREEMRTYCSDSEYDERTRDVFQKVPSVEIFHHMAKSVKAAGVEGGEEIKKDRRAYESISK